MNLTVSKYGLFYPLRLLTGQNIIYYLKYVRDIEKLSHNELKCLCWKKIEKILNFSFIHIPYYSELFSSNHISPVDIKCSEDLLKIPPLTKEIVQNNPDLLKNSNIKKHYKRTTSGSQGTPLTFFKDRNTLACMDAVMYHVYGWHGIKIGEPQARFWGMPMGRYEQIKSEIKDWSMNRKRLSAFDLNIKAFEKYYSELKQFSPRYFYGYPSLIYEFAMFVKEFEKDIKFLNMRGIIGTGEIILLRQKSEIEDIFNCRFLNEYGCTETGIIGFECRKGNMHLMAYNIFMEVIKDGKQVYDEEGEIYITELNTFTFPFIRYKIGDIGLISKSKCECGINLPLIKITKGRSDSYILTPSGAKVYDAVFAYTLKKGVVSFKAVQTSLNNIDVYLKVNNMFSEELKRYYLETLKKKIDPQMNIIIKIVEVLPREPSGKLRYFIPFRNNAS